MSSDCWEGERAFGVVEEVLDVAAAHQLLDEVELLAPVRRGAFADVVDGDDVLVCEATHRLGLAHDALAADIVEAFGLDQRERDVAIEQRVVREEDPLLAAFAEEAQHSVAAGGEVSRVRWGVVFEGRRFELLDDGRGFDDGDGWLFGGDGGGAR